MSEAREVFAGLVEVWNEGDLERFLATIDPDAVWQSATVAAVEGANASEFRGHDGFRRGWSELREGAHGGFRLEPEHVVECGEDGLFAVLRRGLAGASELARDDMFALVRVRDGLTVSLHTFLDGDQALATAQAEGFFEQQAARDAAFAATHEP